MSYATVNDMVARFGKEYLENVLDDTITGTGTDGESPDPYVNAALEEILLETSNVIDSYLRERYAIPVLDPVIKAVCMKMSIYECYSHAQGRAAFGDIKPNYDNCISWLKDVAKGIVALNVTVEPTTSPTGEGARMLNSARLTTDIDSFAISEEPYE